VLELARERVALLLGPAVGAAPHVGEQQLGERLLRRLLLQLQQQREQAVGLAEALRRPRRRRARDGPRTGVAGGGPRLLERGETVAEAARVARVRGRGGGGRCTGIDLGGARELAADGVDQPQRERAVAVVAGLDDDRVFTRGQVHGQALQR